MPSPAAEPRARGVCAARDPFGARREAQGRLQPPAGPCRDGAVLCCSSRRVGGVVPVEPVLGDLRARGQDQDAAVRGPAARRESLRGPRAAGQALQYRDLSGSVPLPPSPPAPPRPRPQPWDGRGKPRAGEPGLCSRCGGCSGARDGRYGRCGTATGTWHSPGAQGGDGTGCTLLPLWRTSSVGQAGGPGAPATGRRGQPRGALAAGVARGRCGVCVRAGGSAVSVSSFSWHGPSRGGCFWGRRAAGASHAQPGEAGGGLGARGAGEPLGSGCTHPAAAVAGPCPRGTGLLPCTPPARRAAARATGAPTAPSPPAPAPTAAPGLWGSAWSSSGGSQRVPWGLTWWCWAPWCCRISPCGAGGAGPGDGTPLVGPGWALPAPGFGTRG